MRMVTNAQGGPKVKTAGGTSNEDSEIVNEIVSQVKNHQIYA